MPPRSHILYVKSGTTKNCYDTIELLSFLAENLQYLKQLEIVFTIQKFKESDLKNSFVLDMLKGKNINIYGLPALVTKNRTYYGLNDIITIYTQSINHHLNINKNSGNNNVRGNNTVGNFTNEDYLHDYMYDQIKNYKDDDAAVGESTMGKDLQAQATKEYQRRQSKNKTNKMNSIDKIIQEATGGQPQQQGNNNFIPQQNMNPLDAPQEDTISAWTNQIQQKRLIESPDGVDHFTKNEETIMPNNFRQDNLMPQAIFENDEDDNGDNELLAKFYENQNTSAPF